MTTTREKRVSPSNPKLEKAGWHELDPTSLIEKGREKIREATDGTKRLSPVPEPIPAKP